MSENIRFEYGNNVGTDENDNYQSWKLTSASNQNPENKIQPSQSKCLQLRFLNSSGMPDVAYTGLPIGRDGASVQVALVDGLTGNVVKSRSEVEILVLDEAFSKNDTDNWTSAEFEAYILGGRQGKTSLLRRTRINLIDGCGCLNGIVFSHTKYPLPKTNVRLGARVVRGVDSSDGTRIREAISKPFTVMDRRGIKKKDYQLSLTDEVSRLKNIGKDGPYHKKLRGEKIITIEDFLTKHQEDPQNLQSILGETMSPKKLEAAINHAKTCEQNVKKHSQYYSLTSEQNAGVVFNNVKEEMDSASEAKHDAVKTVSDIQKDETADMEGAAAFTKWGKDVSVDDDSSKPFLVANSDESKNINSMVLFGHPLNILHPESMTGAFCEEEHLWHLLDTDTIIRAFYGNEHQQIVHPFDPFQSTIFCSPADLHNVLHGLLVRDVPQAQRGWKLIFSILRWFAIRRTVARKLLHRGIKRKLLDSI